MQQYFHPQMTRQQLLAMSALGLAHVGDGVFELLVRTKLCLEGGTNNHNLHKMTVARVCAPAQAVLADRLQPLLTEEEAGYYLRGRSAHTHAIPKNATAAQYAKATGLEALFGALYLSGQTERLQELFALITEEEYAL